MEIPHIVDEIIQWLPSVDYNSSTTELSIFETTIRYLGGMLSGYDLLKGPLSHLPSNASYVDKLLDQSVNLADALKYGFETKTGIPHHTLELDKHSWHMESINTIASVGTMQLEWQRLSDLIGNPEYGRLVQKAEEYLLKPKTEVWPGLIPTKIDIYTTEFTDSAVGWGASQDSFYEYLIKMYVYDSSRYGNYSDRWLVAANSTMQHLAAHPSKNPNLTFLETSFNKIPSQSSSHLTCFASGNFILGGHVFDKEEYIDFGLKLVDSCHHTYNSTKTGLGPEGFAWNPSEVPPDQKDFYEKNGYYITNGIYILRPEVIESYYYAYRVTGNEIYRDWAWDAFVSMNKTCRAEKGFTSISDVNAPGGGQSMNEQESFLFAEVMKYSYMIQRPVCMTLAGFRGLPMFLQMDADFLIVSSVGFWPPRQEPVRLQYRSSPYEVCRATCMIRRTSPTLTLNLCVILHTDCINTA